MPADSILQVVQTRLANGRAVVCTPVHTSYSMRTFEAALLQALAQGQVLARLLPRVAALIGVLCNLALVCTNHGEGAGLRCSMHAMTSTGCQKANNYACRPGAHAL